MKQVLPVQPIYSRSFFVLLLCVSLAFSSAVSAQGDLLIMPKRVTFEGSKRSEDLNLANVGKDSATYVISFIQIRMKDDGSFEKITQPDSAQNFADKNLRFFPRTVTLAPNEAQTVKVQVSKKNELAPGEYRSHLYFRAVPKEKPLGEPDPEDSTISIRLIPIYGISIPVIMRLGENNAAVTFSNKAFHLVNDTVPVINVTLNRRGNMSVYGDVSVDHIAYNGKVTSVGKVKGLAVYTPNKLRNLQVQLDKVRGINYHSGKLHITYSDQSAKNTVLAEDDIVLK
jgi:hypothetical protein